jgi:hypothetical protein
MGDWRLAQVPGPTSPTLPRLLVALFITLAIPVSACGSGDDGETTTVTEQARGPTGPTGPTGPSGVSLAPGAALRTVKEHYRDLNRGRFQPAWEDFSGQLKAELGPYSKFVDGYSLTEGTHLQKARATSLSSDTVKVAVDFNADDVDACGDHVAQRFAGSWLVRLETGGPVLDEADIEFIEGGTPVRDASQCPAPVQPEPPPPDLGETYGSDYPGAHLPPPEAGGFCATHDCIPNFDEGNGYVVQCEDGTWSQSGGIQGACSYHGGVRGP